MIQAARKGHKEIVKLLLECNADVNVRKKDGDTALTAAIEPNSSDKEIVEMLLQHNSDVDAKTRYDLGILIYIIGNLFREAIILRVHTHFFQLFRQLRNKWDRL